MEELRDGEQEISYRNEAKLEVQLVWNSLINLAYSRVEDHQTGEKFLAIAPDGTNPMETFVHPFVYRVYQPGEEGHVSPNRRLYAATEANQVEGD